MVVDGYIGLVVRQDQFGGSQNPIHAPVYMCNRSQDPCVDGSVVGLEPPQPVEPGGWRAGT